MAMKGIDVSKWQGVIDFAKVKKSGVDFVIIRAGYGKEISQKDPYFERNYAGAKTAGLYVGTYWYSYADSVENAKREADTCLAILAGKQFELPIYYDMEEQKQFARGKSFCDSIITAFCNALEAAGYYAGLYMSLYNLDNYASEAVRGRYTVWVAQYASQCTYKGQYGIWQYSSEGNISGVSGNCDMDECYIDFPSIIMDGSLNGYVKGSVPAPAVKTVDELAREVIAGMWGNGEDRKKRLTDDGYDYAAVQKQVDALIKS